MRYLYFFIFLFLLPPDLYAQKENHIWYMGIPQALDFNTSPPRLIPMQANVQNGGAAVSDSTGKLLFYTNGRVVLDADHNIMPGSVQLDAAGSFLTTASNNIVYNKEEATLHIRNMNPYIVQYNKAVPVYYLFYTHNQYQRFYPSGSYDTSHLLHTIVDMRLRNGKGDVPPQEKNISIDSVNLLKTPSIWVNNTGMLAVDGRCNTWLIYTKMVNGYIPNLRQHEYHIKRIEEDGTIVDHSIRSFPAQRKPDTWTNTEVEINKQATMFLENIFYSENWDSHNFFGRMYRPYILLDRVDKLYVYDFDKNIGEISNFRYRGPAELAYFSPLGSKLISFEPQSDSIWNDLIINRFDTTFLGDSLAIVSETEFLDLSDFPDFKDNDYKYRYLCPDFRMHTGADGDLYALVNISYHNDFIFADVHTKTFILRLKDTDGEWGLSKVSVLAELDKNAILNNYQIPNNEEHLRGAKVTRTYGFPWYMAYIGQEAVIHNTNVWIDTAAVVPLCKGRAYLKAPYPDLPFVWWNGSTADSVEVTAAGSYRVTTTLPNCSFSQDIVVVSPSVQLPPDTTICMQTPLQLRGVLNLAENPVWNTGETTPNITVTETGRYILRGESVCGRVADTIQITVRDCTCNPFVPNAFTPNNDGVNDVFKPMMQCNYSNYSFEVFNRFGNKVFQSRSADVAWDGLHLGKPADFGVYFWQLQFKNELGETMHFKGDVTLLR